MKHVLFKCEQPCERQHCPYCDGGLSSCTICNGAEGSLPTDCPGVAMTHDQQDQVYSGEIDYKDPVGWGMGWRKA